MIDHICMYVFFFFLVYLDNVRQKLKVDLFKNQKLDLKLRKKIVESVNSR